MRRTTPALWILVVLAIAAHAMVMAAQSNQADSSAATFEVASIKRAGPGRSPLATLVGAGQVAVRPGGRFAAPSVTLRDLVRAAYGVLDVQVVGGPEWAATTRFDVEATTKPDVTDDEARAMLRRLLQQRFSVAAHAGTRDLPVTVLELARADGRLGPQLRRAGSECAPPAPPSFLPGVPPPPPPPPGAGRPLSLGASRFRCPAIVLTGHMSLRDATMAQFANRLVPIVGRLVVDRTGLTSGFDLDLTYAPDPGTPLTVNGAAITIDAPALPAAMREQLGLKIETSKAAVDVVVIDRAEPPTEN